MSEIAPGWTNARMTRSQVRKYVREMKKAQDNAKEKLKQAENSWELAKEKEELEELENLLDEL